MLKEQFIVEVALKRVDIPSFSHYPFCLNAVHNLTSLQLHPSVTFIVGENGSGKSTLLEAVAVALGFNPEGGSKNFNFGTFSSHSELHRYLRISRGVRTPKDGYFLRAESFFNVATEIHKLDEEPATAPPIINSYGGKSLHAQSHGESFLSLIYSRFGGNGIYILDEPEAALSPTKQMALLTRIHDLVEQNSQFIIATHSPIIMSYPDSIIYQIEEDGAAITEYEKTEHYNTMRYFMNNYVKVLSILMNSEK
ncbi:MAG: AAA family ATPase [Candidatus Sabulitectum sp.]|nr:AAA family ATPase [Candidatus Sabulitectum sp.]